MSYSAVSDIQQDFPSVIFTDDATSKVKLASIPSFIADADALIDSYLSKMYATPVTASGAQNLLRLYSRSLVADKITGLLQIKNATAAGANQNVRTGLSSKDVINALRELSLGDAILPGTDQASDVEGDAIFATGGRVIDRGFPRFPLDEDSW